MEIHLYDFDGTLFRSPVPPATWQDAAAWWSDSISLSVPCVPERPGGSWWNEAVVTAAKASINDPNVLAVLCTGRSGRSFARLRVPELLRQKGLAFAAVYLKPSIEAPTGSFKRQVLTKLLGRYPDTEAVHIYEDRAHHLDDYRKFVEGFGIRCVPHLIRTPDVPCEAASVQRVAQRWVRAVVSNG